MDLARAVFRKDQVSAGTAGGPWRGRRTVCRGAAASNTTFIRATPLGHPLAPILAPWLDNHMYPHHDTTSAWDAIAWLRNANVPEPLIARMMGRNAAHQFGTEPPHEAAEV